uniref:Uncharacterized protein n=1 Tax=viral metagenome TaxID=1070528 RepID=A0A6C0H4N9_9ZZZZ
MGICSSNLENIENEEETEYINSKAIKINIFTLKMNCEEDIEYGDIIIFYVSYEKQKFKNSYIMSFLDNMFRTLLNLTTHFAFSIITNIYCYTMMIIGDIIIFIYNGTIAMYDCILSLDNILL